MDRMSEQFNGVIANLMVEAVDSDEAVDDLLLLTEIRKVSLPSCYFCTILIPLVDWYWGRRTLDEKVCVTVPARKSFNHNLPAVPPALCDTWVRFLASWYQYFHLYQSGGSTESAGIMWAQNTHQVFSRHCSGSDWKTSQHYWQP